MFNVKISLLCFLLITLIVVSLSVTVGQSKTEAVVQAETALKSIPVLRWCGKSFPGHETARFCRSRKFTLAAALVALRKFRRDFVGGPIHLLTRDR